VALLAYIWCFILLLLFVLICFMSIHRHEQAE
jgi:hypothetical protein